MKSKTCRKKTIHFTGPDWKMTGHGNLYIIFRPFQIPIPKQAIINDNDVKRANKIETQILKLYG